ncbi:hypothetical protein H310_02416 [Aphanomyces invadans]|uniref:Ribophorin II n=1 Tax=Aphanomyces invadans TaxID=157072 RepID=A0A024UNM4_9STRA|nr:hypothetical protein H310_02416 [Aphanomyces invadans]ETW08046.1 hypothetical protein H310_02416 [Aphanomyces invadans]|eukprot:XP_008864139.1 hypothetical protein H310_02416 [Aphanomyces invadans]
MRLVRWLAGVLTSAVLGTALELSNPVQRGGGDVTFIFTGVEDKSPVLKSIQNAATLRTIAADVPLVHRVNVDDASVSEFMLDGELALPGLYKLLVQDGKASRVFHAALTTKVFVAHATIHGAKVEFGSSLSAIPTLKPRDKFSIEVGLQDAYTFKPMVAHQAVLRFTNTESSVDATFPLESTTDSTMQAAVTVDASLLSGLYGVQLIVGDVQFENAIEWNLGQVALDIPPAPPAPSPPLYTTSLLHESDVTLHALPEITHAMRPPAARPREVVSYVFTVLVLVPLVVFVLWALRTQSLANVPSTFGGVVVTIGFFASVLAVLGLYGLFWLQLTMFAVLTYLAVLGPVVIATGHLALHAVMAGRPEASNSTNKPKCD